MQDVRWWVKANHDIPADAPVQAVLPEFPSDGSYLHGMQTDFTWKNSLRGDLWNDDPSASLREIASVMSQAYRTALADGGPLQHEKIFFEALQKMVTEGRIVNGAVLVGDEEIDDRTIHIWARLPRKEDYDQKPANPAGSTQV